MALSAHEKYDGRTGSDSQLTRVYEVLDASDEEEALNKVISTSPTRIMGLERTSFTYREFWSNSGDTLANYEVTVNWGPVGTAGVEGGTAEYRFNYQAQSAHIFQSLSTPSSDFAAPLTAAPDFGGAINVVSEGGKTRVEGLQLPVPPETFTYVFQPRQGFISRTYERTVEGLVGKVNNTIFKGRPVGSLMLVRVAGGHVRRAFKLQSRIEFGFSYIENATNIPVGAMTVSSKDGHDLLWAYYGEDEDNDVLIKKPIAAYVERVHYRGNFNALRI